MSKKGTSVVDLLLVIAIFTIIAATASPFLGRMIQTFYFYQARDRLVAFLSTAQINALANRQNATWGVCLSGTQLHLITGTCASPAYLLTYDLPSSVSLTGLTTVQFTPITGEPTSTPIINLSTAQYVGSVTVNAIGGLNIN